MRLLFEVARRGYRQYAAYRGATIGGLFTNTVFGLMRTYILLAVFATRLDVNGLDRVGAVTYVWLGQALLMPTHMWGWWPIGERIRSGDIAIDLYRPVDLQAYWMAFDSGRAIYHLLYRGIAPFVVGAVLFSVRLPESVFAWLWFGLFCVLGVWISFAFRFILNMSVFWLLDWRGVGYIGAMATNLLSGFVIPLQFFPDWFAVVARSSPFAFMFQVPVDVFLGHFNGAELAGLAAAAIAWLIVLLAIGRVMLSRATRRVVVQGG